MSLGQRLLELRKSKHLSQEEIAEKLNITRQTVSKWETDQSTPDFDKIVPICELFEISTEELLTGKKEEIKEEIINNIDIKEKRAKGTGKSILLYVVAVAWIMVSVPVLMINPVLASAIFLLICGYATYVMIYTCMIYKIDKKEKKEKEENKLLKTIDEVVSIIFLIIYLLVSFATMAWHITWIIWIVYSLVMKIIKLIIELRGMKDEK